MEPARENMKNIEGPEESGFETVRIPSELYRKISAWLIGSEFASVDEWVVKLIENNIEPPEASLSEADEATVRKKLKTLGYE